jgi:SIR2-like domain
VPSTDSTTHEHPGPKSECLICRNEREFEMPDQLLDTCADGRLVVFAGAGVSTESRTVRPETFYDEIAAELGGLRDEHESFPDLMSRFESTKTRRVLLQRIVERLDYINAFPELQRMATRFHSELATLFYVTEIVTTNWDPYFEQVCGALPLVTDRDFALSDLPGRKVLKIHGSIYNVGSIIATRQDYDRCYRTLSRSVLGGTLKNLLATKTVLFVGYSFGDNDFSRIYRFIRREMADVLPRSYVVTLDQTVPKEAGESHAITTDGTYFVRRLKAELLPRGCLLDDQQWNAIPPALIDLEQRHVELYAQCDLRRLPAAVLCGHYQDGLLHALERMLERRGTGEYSHIHHVERLIEQYEDMRRDAVRSKRYHDASYIEGYQNGLLYLLSDPKDRRSLPRYFVYGSKLELNSLAAFKKEAARASELHHQAYRQAERIAARWSPGIVPHHMPQL